MEWFIQLHKKICEWEWYTDIPTKVLFFHILLKCNFKEAKWRGKVVKPWEFITSIEHLSLETWLSRQQIRTAIQKLKDTWEITHYSTNEYTTLALNNWEAYNTQDNKRITNEQQTNNKRITTTNKNNKEYKDNKENNTDTDISKDIWSTDLAIEEPKEYWNTEINQILLLLKQTVWCDDFKESQQWQRKYWKHFLNLWSKIWNDEFWKRLQWILSDKFKSKNCNSLKYLYDQMKSFIHSPVIRTKERESALDITL